MLISLSVLSESTGMCVCVWKISDKHLRKGSFTNTGPRPI